MEGGGGPRIKPRRAHSAPSISLDQQLTNDYDARSSCGSQSPVATSSGVHTLVCLSPIAYGRSDGVPLLRLDYERL